MTGLFAGGLRDRRPAETREVGKPDNSGGLGTYPCIRLEQAYAPGSRADLRSKGEAVLGQGPSHRQTVGSTIVHFSTKLLPPRRHTLGCGCALSQRSSMGRLSACVHRWGGGKG